jgi:hypothetical protein
VYVHAYINDELYAPWDGSEVTLYQSFSPVKLQLHVVADLAALVAEQPPTKLLFIDQEDRVGPHVARLQVHFSDRLQIARSHAHFGELTAPGCTKGRALMQFASAFGIAREAVIAIGDQQNDIEMVEWAGFGVAVRSGPPELCAVARTLIDGPERAGVAVFLHDLLQAADDAA